MTVNELIQRLSALSEEQRKLPVALADWNECYRTPTDTFLIQVLSYVPDWDKTGSSVTAVVLGGEEVANGKG